MIKELEISHIKINAVAGSGKTTTALMMAKHYSSKKILLLTYNNSLKNETRNKVFDMDLENIEVHSYHSFVVKYYSSKAYTDADMTIALIVFMWIIIMILSSLTKHKTCRDFITLCF